MKQDSLKIVMPVIIFSIILVSVISSEVNAESVPEWIKNNALWYGQGTISETEFLNAIKFLIENDIIIIENKDISSPQNSIATITIPNGNFDITGAGFYSPLNLEIHRTTTVTWINEDSVPHNIQSQDAVGKTADLFNSPPLNTGDKFEFTFAEDGVYNYFCSFHPWRVGVVTVK